MSAPPLLGRRFGARFLRLQFGLFVFALSIAVMLEAHIGLDPWSCLHQALSMHSGLSFGRVNQCIGLTLIVVGLLALGVRPWIGTVFNMAVIGPWLDLLRAQPWFPSWDGGVTGVAAFLCGMLLMGLATGLYIGADMGAGPRDGFVLGLSERIRRSVRATRIGIELSVLTLGFALGGPLGIGTLLFALGMGPIMQASLRILHVRKPVAPRARTG